MSAPNLHRSMLPVRPPRPTVGGCNRPNCHRHIVVTFGWDGIVLSFCLVHAEDKAGQPDSEVVWLSAAYRICDRCHRIIPRPMGDHLNLHGEPCPA